MSKSKKNFKFRDEENEYVPLSRVREDSNRKVKKRMNAALRTMNLDEFQEWEDNFGDF
jgi:hypothetical protein